MNFEEYKSNALRTEAPLTSLEFSDEGLMLLLAFGVRAAKLMDLVKKTLVYKKEFDYDVFIEHIGAIEQTLDVLADAGPGVSEKGMKLGTMPIDFKPCAPNPRITHGAIGMFGEAGELLEALLNQMVTGKLDMVNVSEETADSDWYKVLIHDETGVSETDSRTRNIAKLKKRYGDKFSTESALTRDLVGERAILEEPAANEVAAKVAA